MPVRPVLARLLAIAAVGGGALVFDASAAPTPPSRLVVWAWERPEDLRFLPPGAEIAVQSGFVELSGDRAYAHGRRFPLLARPGQVTTAVVHIQIDPHRPLLWTPALRADAARAAVQLADAPGMKRVQIDFEVPASQRQVLLDLLTDVRAALPPSTPLSMTALASWCEHEDWLRRAPVDEIAPMLFRMGPEGGVIVRRLAAGGDFQPVCRSALAVSADMPLPQAPAGRRVYLFDPRSWTPAAFATVQKRVDAWRAP